jgi:hypothetical protein
MKIKKLIVLPLALAALALGSFSSASAQVIGPRVALQFGTNGLTSPLVASSTNAVIARLLLDTTGSTESVRIASLPFNLVTGSGANASTLNNCRVFNEADLNTALNTSNATTTFFSGINNIAFNSALVLAPNTLTTLSLRCDIAGNLVSGGTYTVNMNTSNVVATGASTGIPAAVTIRGVTVVPPVVTPPVVVVPPVTPGVPATGAGSEAAQNVAMLLASLLIAGLGFTSLNLTKKAE